MDINSVYHDIDRSKLPQELERHVLNIEKIIHRSQEVMEGNCMYEHTTFNRCTELLNKQLNLIDISRDKKNILEIGFNGGHSCLLFLLGSSTSKIDLFDLGDHRYAHACFEYLNSSFPNRLTITYGDSNQTLLNHKGQYDLIHIDGGHMYHIAKTDVLNCKKLSIPDTPVIYDDVWLGDLGRLYSDLIDSSIIEPIEGVFRDTTMYKHALCKYI